MTSLYTFTAPRSPCGYLADREAQLHYEVAWEITPAEYEQRIDEGWRRFGHALFRPACGHCDLCRPIRIPVATFEPNRSQRRALHLNEDSVNITVNAPSASRENLALYDRYHQAQHLSKGWPEYDPKDEESYLESFVVNPFATEEWSYRIDGRLVGVGYVDSLPKGLSAIYFIHDPEERHRSLGVFNILSILRAAAAQKKPFVYLGYYVEGCRSMEYKLGYRPNELLGTDGVWRSYR